MADEPEAPTTPPDLNDPARALTPAEQAMAASDPPDHDRGRRKRGALTAAERAAGDRPAATRVVRHKDPVQLSQTLRQHLAKHPKERRTELLALYRDVLLDTDALALVKALDTIPGAVDADDLDVADMTALHRLPLPS